MLEIGVVVAIILALGQFAKLYIDGRYIPLVTLVIGLIAGYFYLPHVTIQEAVMNGVVVALSSNGLFDISQVIKK
jgi:hypothetical protein